MGEYSAAAAGCCVIRTPSARRNTVQRVPGYLTAQIEADDIRWERRGSKRGSAGPRGWE